MKLMLGALFALFVLTGAGLSSAHAGDDFINTDEGWSRDVSKDVADELRERCARRGEVPDFLLDFLEAHETGRPIQLTLPMVLACR